MGYQKIIAGEASPYTKLLGHQVDNMGLPRLIEGIEDVIPFDPAYPTIIHRYRRAYDGMAKVLGKNGLHTILELQHMYSPPIINSSSAATKAALPHVRNGADQR